MSIPTPFTHTHTHTHKLISNMSNMSNISYTNQPPSIPLHIFNIINNTNINPLAIPNHEITINQMAKLDRSKSVLLVDTSYWLYYRYFALRTWYSKAYSEISNTNNFNMEHKWLEDNIFMTKFKKLFFENLKTICRKYNIPIYNIVFCIDCTYKDIWRNSHTSEYKATRPESLKKKQFNSFDVFSYIKKEYIPELQVKYGVKILYNSRCEADDIIGQISPYLINAGVPRVIIVANDNDYLQICNSRISMIKGGNNNSISDISNNEGERYLIKKILLGDVSDNIKGCQISFSLLDNLLVNSTNQAELDNNNSIFKNITKITINQIMENVDRYNIFLELLKDIRSGVIHSKDNARLNMVRHFYENTILMDFQMIPKDIKSELVNKFKNLIE
jgi:5'-3' exonuclease